jgi:hypothetical protein
MTIWLISSAELLAASSSRMSCLRLTKFPWRGGMRSLFPGALAPVPRARPRRGHLTAVAAARCDGLPGGLRAGEGVEFGQYGTGFGRADLLEYLLCLP